jgi:hypothetical protein
LYPLDLCRKGKDCRSRETARVVARYRRRVVLEKKGASMFDNRQRIMERVARLPKGTTSPSGRCWCVTCKMLFAMDEPVCPYMPRMCINTPIPVEFMPLESAIALEKLGPFYPKIP